MRAWLMILFIGLGVGSVAQNSSESVKDSLNEIPFINTIEQSLNLFYAEYANATSLDSL